ncbi:MAG: hypothetical protein M3680_31265 [Myxococcota bacterium]|nr:hypothetical protein [Myxococcota bacterium]
MARPVAKLAKLLGVVVVVWVVGLVIAGFALSGRTGQHVADRLGATLQATATIEDSDLALLRGMLELEDLALRRDDLIGRLSLDVGRVRCDLPPLGLALVDRTCGELVVRDIRMEVSTAALFGLQRPKRTPLRADRVVIDNAELVFSPSAFLPSLGRVEIKIEHAEAGPTVFKTPLSWLFSLRELRASLALPAGITLQLTYRDGRLGAAGSLFGSTPIEIPVTLPVASAADDAQGELRRLFTFGRELANQLVAQRAQDWLRKTLPVP